MFFLSTVSVFPYNVTSTVSLLASNDYASTVAGAADQSSVSLADADSSFAIVESPCILVDAFFVNENGIHWG